MFWTSLKRVSAPTSQILTLDEVKDHLNIGDDFEDDYLTSLIDVATAYIEGPQGIGIGLLTQSWRLSLDAFPRIISLPFSPVQSIDSVTYLDASGTVQTVDPASYVVDLDSDPVRIVAKTGWPALPLTGIGSVKVVFTVGFGDHPSDIPADIRHAAKVLIAHLHLNREAASEKAFVAVPFSAAAVMDRYRVGLFG